MANVAVDIHAGQSQTDAEQHRQKANAAKLTQFTYVQNTNGAGYRQMGFLFDCTYSNEPVFTYGCTLVSIATAGWLPTGNAIVTHWVQDANGRYNGVLLVVQVTLVQADGFKYSSKTPTGPVDNAKPVVAHNLTFTGPGLARTKAETTLAMHTLSGLATGIT